MIRVTFDFNPETNSVTNVKAVSSSANSKKTQSSVITVNGGSVKLTQEALNLLKVEAGDRLCIRFNKLPIIATPEALGEDGGGNLITKSLTVTCKGKTGEALAAFGQQFTYELESEGYLVLKPVSGVKENIDEPIKEQINSISDDDFLMSIAGAEEITFDLVN